MHGMRQHTAGKKVLSYASSMQHTIGLMYVWWHGFHDKKNDNEKIRPDQVRWTPRWSLSGHQHVCHQQVTPKRTSKGPIEKTSNEIHFQLNQYLSHNPHSRFKPTWNSLKNCVCTSNDICWQIKNIYRWCYWGPTAKTGSILGLKQTWAIPN